MSQATNFKYRSDIDGLRAIAVFFVVAYHAGFPGFSGGYVGVDVFFVISGFLITGVLFKEADATGTISLPSFYAKRFKRLYPTLVFVILTTILLWGCFFLGITANTNNFIHSIRYCLFGLANIFFSRNTGGYFDGNSEEMPLLHFWSLAVEEQFYVFWPLIIILMAKLKFSFLNFRQRTFYSLIILSLLSFTYTEFLLQNDLQKEAFYWMPARAWEMGIGGLLFFMRPQFEARMKNKLLLFTLAFLGLLAIFSCAALFSIDTVFPGRNALIPVLGTALLILSGAMAKGPVDKLLSLPWMTKLGMLSYGWYLWHWPLLAFARIHFMGETPPLLWRILAVLGSLAMAEISLRLVESPIRFSKIPSLNRPRFVILGSLILSGVITLSAPLLSLIEVRTAPPELSEITKLAEQRTMAQLGCDGNQANFVGKHCDIQFETSTTQTLPELILWGDSHAQALFPAVVKFSKKYHLNSYLYANSGNIPLLGIKKIYTQQKISFSADFNKRVFDSIRSQASRSKISVILSARWNHYSGIKPIAAQDKPFFLTPSRITKDSLKVIEKSLVETLAKLKDAGVYKILIILPYPTFKYHVLECFNRADCDTPTQKLLLRRKKILEIFLRRTKNIPHIRLMDPIEVFCNKLSCPQVIETKEGKEIPVVQDDDHASVQAALHLEEMREADFHWLIE